MHLLQELGWLVRISFNKQQFVDLGFQSPISIKDSMLK